MGDEVACRARARWGQTAPWGVALVLVASTFCSAPTWAQRPSRATPPSPYRLRCSAERAALCVDVARAMRIRAAVAVRVGDPAGAYRAEARDVLLADDRGTPPIADGAEPRRLAVTLVSTEGTELRTVVELGDSEPDAIVRAVVLATEALIDLDASPPARAEERSTRVFERTRLPDVPRGLGVSTWHDPRPRTVMARPVIFGRMLGGISLERGDLLFGPGIGFGLCVVGQCAVIEADLSLVPVVVEQPELTVEYTAVTFAMRVMLRPVVVGRLSFAVTGGALARLGTASTSEGVSRTVSDAGFRGTLEAAYRVAGPFEVVVEGGVDALVQRARFIRGEKEILLEDAVTPWVVLGGRVRP